MSRAGLDLDFEIVSEVTTEGYSLSMGAVAKRAEVILQHPEAPPIPRPAVLRPSGLNRYSYLSLVTVSD